MKHTQSGCKRITLFASILFSFFAIAQSVQSRLWSVPPKEIIFPALATPNLPAPSAGDYNGSPSFYANNAMHDPNGNLLFFINDGNVYDYQGRFIGSIFANVGGNDFILTGTTEWVIVPVPNHCQQYYLVAGYYSDVSGSSLGGAPRPYYIILDLTLPNQNGNPQAYGDFVGNDGMNGQQLHSHEAFFLDDPTMAGVNNLAYSSASSLGSNMHFAVTPLRPNGSTRFLFIDNVCGAGISRFLVTPNGIIYDNYTVIPTNSDGHGQVRAEMEVVIISDPSDPNVGNYRLAVPYTRVNFTTSAQEMGVFVQDIDFNTGNYIGSAKFVFLPRYFNGTDYITPDVHGLEFSANGKFLYVTHTTPPYIEYSDISQASPTFSALQALSNISPNLNNPQDFQNSQIELGNDGRLYFAASNRLAALSINFSLPPNAVGVFWTDNAIPSVTVPISSAIFPSQVVISSDISDVRLLNDQVDGEVYQVVSQTSPPDGCCLTGTIFTANNYIAGTPGTPNFTTYANANQIWTPTNNPFGGTSTNPVTIVMIKNTLTIPAGKTITIKNMIFKFAPRVYSPNNVPGGEVIILGSSLPNIHGGKLILDNTTFTSYDGCGLGMWEGVEVNGRASLPQAPNLNLSQSQQGWLVLQNNAVISNAYTGTLAGKRATPFPNITWDQNFNGGIITATNSKFLNNTIAVQFRPYTDPSNVLHNYSYFTRCDFLTTINPLNDPHSATRFVIFVQMMQTAGIVFSGNNFNNSSALPSNSVLDMPSNGYGIYGFDANFQVLPACANPQLCTQFIPNTFQNLGYGVLSWSSNPLNSVKIDGSQFLNNYRGVLINFVDYSTITNNHFTIIKYPFLAGPGPAYGIYLNNSTGYQVEANDFAYSTAPINTLAVGSSYGVIVSNSLSANNLIYRNIFHHIYIGCQTQRVNCQVVPNPMNGDPYNPQGLQFICNSFDANSNDNFNIVQPNGCEDFFQGSKTRTADNCFADDNVHYDYWVNFSSTIDPFTNLTHLQTPILYSYSTVGACSTTIPTTITPASITLQDASLTSNFNCTSMIGCNPSCQRTSIAATTNEIANLTSLIDGGITSTLFADINGNMPAGQLKNVLMQSSPYLSDQVLIAYINKHNVPLGNLKDILLANSPLRPAVISAFNGMSSTLPNGIRNNILFAQQGLSPLDGLYGQIAEATANRDFAIDGLIRDFLFDTTIVGGLDSVQFVLKAYLITNGDRCKIAAAQVAAKEFAAATATLDSIAIANNNTLDNSCQLLQILIRLEQSADGCFSLKTDPAFAGDSATLSQIAADTMADGCVGAQALMKAIFNLSFQEVVDLVPNSSSARLASPDQETTEMEQGKIYPNPNNGTMIFSYEIPENSKGILVFYDISGKQVDKFILREGQSTAQISDENLQAGIYFYRFIVDDEQINSGKFVIVK
ncbi:MAG: T9SS type A sorting domain-containing protein [Bacteroidetes bacterium]|nr:T9SS type A sorting domain-containing protein [Bacteroidota bacterium]